MNAFKEYLKRSFPEEAKLAFYLRGQILLNPALDNQVWEILEATGDKEYTADTFLKAARIILS